MSSSQPFQSSQASISRSKSKFTYRHLHHLAASSPTCPLRVIAHIDLDAFYAQCEQIRLDLPETTPLAVQQWQGLIAINYPAREFGLSRHVTVAEAREKCPEIVLQHVATWREGDDKWAYREDSPLMIKTDKVSLDPYREQSRNILATIKEALTNDDNPTPKVEKASIDEVFVDLSAPVYALLLQRYPEQLAREIPHDDATTPLPAPPTSVLDWQTDALVDLDQSQSEFDDPDWDDVCMQLGSEIIRNVRAVVRGKLRFTCSAGIARNKLLAKLGSGHKKPNSQTIIRNRAIGAFLEPMKFTKIRMLGGKLGDEVVAAFNTDLVLELLKVELKTLQSKLGPDTGNWLYGAIRGEDATEVNTRTALKSMLSAKSFRPVINDFETATRWLRIFVADIYARCVVEGVLENRRRPRTLTIHHRQGAQTRSRQLPIPVARSFEESTLFDLAKTLMAQIIVDGRAWPCANLSLSVGSWEDGVSGNRSIGTFLVRGSQAKAMLDNERTRTKRDQSESDVRPPSEKRHKSKHGAIDKFFSRQHSGESNSGNEEEPARDDFATSAAEVDIEHSFDMDEEDTPGSGSRAPSADPDDNQPPPSAQPERSTSYVRREGSPLRQADISTYFCSACNQSIPESDRTEHTDWHFAKDLEQQMRAEQADATSTEHRAATPNPFKSAIGAPKGRGRPAGRGRSKPGGERGQKKLDFG